MSVIEWTLSYRRGRDVWCITPAVSMWNESSASGKWRKRENRHKIISYIRQRQEIISTFSCQNVAPFLSNILNPVYSPLISINRALRHLRKHFLNISVVPCYPTVVRLDIDPCVCDVTSHYVVGEVWLQDVEIRIDRNLKETTTIWADFQAG